MTTTAPTTATKLADALTANPGCTTAVLASAAGIGRSTAAKLLAEWAVEGSAFRATEGNATTWSFKPEAVEVVATDRQTVQPKRNALPAGYVSPTALAKVINGRGLYRGTREDGLTIQSMYSYIRTARRRTRSRWSTRPRSVAGTGSVRSRRGWRGGSPRTAASPSVPRVPG